MRDRPPRKQKSGAANRAAARERALGELREKADALGFTLVAKGTTLPDDGDGAADFAALGPPPIDEAETALGWVRKVQLVATQVALTKPLTDAVRERLKWAKDMSAVIGMTFSRSSQESKLKDIETELRSVRRKFGTAKVEPGTAVPKSPHARGPRGPRPVPPTAE